MKFSKNALKRKPEQKQDALSKEQTEKVAAVLSSDAYGKSVKEIGTKVLTGAKSYDSFEDIVAIVDEQNAKAKVDAVTGEQPAGTPPAEDPTGPSEKEKMKADAQAIGKKIKREV